MSANVTVIGNLASDPELRFTKDGKAVSTFTVITSTSKKNLAGEWESTDSTPWRVTAWEKVGEHASESLTKGSPVIVYGKAVLESWEKEDGTKGSMMKITAYSVGVDLKRDPVKILKGQGKPSSPAPAGDPWIAEAKDDIPPF
jgi:single-strand DNA-binding protein